LYNKTLEYHEKKKELKKLKERLALLEEAIE